jgi:hypothetical protein
VTFYPYPLTVINSHHILAKIWLLNHVPLCSGRVSTKGNKRGFIFVLMGPPCLMKTVQRDKRRVIDAVYKPKPRFWLIWLNQWTLASGRHDKWDAWQIEHVILLPWFNGL